MIHAAADPWGEFFLVGAALAGVAWMAYLGHRLADQAAALRKVLAEKSERIEQLNLALRRNAERMDALERSDADAHRAIVTALEQIRERVHPPP